MWNSCAVISSLLSPFDERTEPAWSELLTLDAIDFALLFVHAGMVQDVTIKH